MAAPPRRRPEADPDLSSGLKPNDSGLQSCKRALIERFHDLHTMR
jgi:hypothetical protein